MSQCIIWEEGGNVKVFHPSSKSSLTLDEMIERVVPKGVSYKITDSSNLPDRSNRYGWVFDGNSVSVDESIKSPAEVLSEKRSAVLSKLGITEKEFNDLFAS